ncbi:MAG: hypothetical protein WC358_00110 [Ignavibacteria bacterium]|jgi:hypothetical protein
MENIKRIPFADAVHKYFANETGEIFVRKNSELKLVTQYHSNKRDGKLGVKILTKKRGYVFWYVDKLIMWAFHERKGYDYIIVHKDNNLENNNKDNLCYKKEKNISCKVRGNLFNRLSDSEFKIYTDTLDRIPKINHERFNMKALQQYNRFVAHLKSSDLTKRYEKLKEIFSKLEEKYRKEIL